MTKRDERITCFDLQSFGQRFREECGSWRDDELSECLTLTPSAIEKIRTGRINPDGYLLFSMATCGMDIQYMISGVRSGNTYDVAASINRFDEMEMEERDLSPEEIAVAETMAHKPIWANGRRPKWWSHIGVRAVLTSAHRQMTIEGALWRVRHLFGAAQVPSRSSVGRYWQRLDALHEQREAA